MGLLEFLGLVDKHPDVIKREQEERSETHYRELFRKVREEEWEFKEKHKEVIEHHLQKPIHKVTSKELMEVGFMSTKLTRRHFEKIMDDEVK